MSFSKIYSIYLRGYYMRANLILPVLWMILGVFSTAILNAQIADQNKANDTLDDLTVTGTREASKISETPAAISVINQSEISLNKPSHPQQLLSQVPGVGISVTNGEGHATAIRQGFTTAPMYLFLEDGIPIRATGNFNHNALYEVNIASARGVEINRGIGSALYGSDAIGGVINILTKAPTSTNSGDLFLERGSFGFARLLGGIDQDLENNGAMRADINLLTTSGWRDKTAYDRQSLNMRWDTQSDMSTTYKTILGYSKIDQQTGANSALPFNLYYNSPTTNLRSAGYRKVEAIRLSTSIEKDIGGSLLLSVVPYFRKNYMDLNGTYNFTGDARIEVSDVSSYGLLTKVRKNFHDTWQTKLISGVDLDYSPSSRKENSISFSSTTIQSVKSYESYTIGSNTYNYEVLYKNISPYTHLEFSPSDRVHIATGLRYDTSTYSMKNNLSSTYVTSGNFYYYSPESTSTNYQRINPKVGLTYAFDGRNHGFISYREGFRTPSESQLFRGGRSGSTGTIAARQAEALALFNSSSNLKPVIAKQYELGLRGKRQFSNYEIVTYILKKDNDLISQKDATGYSVQTNNGTTEHRGIEFGLGQEILRSFRLDIAGSYAKHTYKNWVASGVDYSNNQIEAAPWWMSNARLTWRHIDRHVSQLEWVKLGPYYLDSANTAQYNGHNIYNLRMSQKIDKNLTGVFRMLNLLDTRYADSASGSGSSATYSPGLARSMYLGLEGKW